jgi:hypothetical protein
MGCPLIFGGLPHNALWINIEEFLLVNWASSVLMSTSKEGSVYKNTQVCIDNICICVNLRVIDRVVLSLEGSPAGKVKTGFWYYDAALYPCRGQSSVLITVYACNRANTICIWLQCNVLLDTIADCVFPLSDSNARLWFMLCYIFAGGEKS